MKTVPLHPAAFRGSGKYPDCRLLASFLLCLASLLPCRSQDDGIREMEQLLYLDETAVCPDDLLQHRQELAVHPLDLNSAGYVDLEASGLFTTYQIQNLLQYRDRYGALLSIYELASIRGFSIQSLQRHAPFLQTGPPGQESRMKRNPLTALVYSGLTWPTASGYKVPEGVPQSVYTGSPWKASIRLKGDISRRLTLGLAMEKDAGEMIFQNRLPSHIKGFLHYRSLDRRMEVILGTFRMQLGLGLIHGSSSMGLPEVAGTGPISLSRIRPYGGVAEAGYLQGLAVRKALGPFQLALWGSLLPRDLSLYQLPDTLATVEWTSRIREGGLHRTSAELAGKNLLLLGSMGTQLLYRHRGLTGGAIYSGQYVRLTRQALDSLQRTVPPHIHHQVSLHWRWQRKNWLIFGELVPARKKFRAMKTGLRYHLNDFLQGGIMCYQYGETHRDVFAASFGSGSHLENENGLVIHIHAEAARQFSAELSSAFFSYPFPRYGSKQASSGFRQHFLLQSTARNPLSWQIGLTHTSKQHTPASETTGPSALLSHTFTRIDGRLKLFPENKWNLMTRMVLNFSSQSNAGTAGAMVQQVNLQLLKTFRLKLHFVAFRIPTWEQRIYIHEPGLYHQFSFPAYAGTGHKGMVSCQWKAWKWLTVEGKISSLVYSDRNSIGSGHDLVEGHRKYKVEVQLRMRH